MIRTDGFYRSDLIEWEDWHGGVHMRGASVQFWRFLPELRWVRCISAHQDLPFWQLSEKHRNAPTGPVILERFTGGTYELGPQNIIVSESSPSPIGPQILRYTWLVSEGGLVPTQPGDYIGSTPLTFVEGASDLA